MNRFVRWAFALALLPIAACSSNTPTVSAPPAPPPPALSDADTAFANTVAASGAFQTQAGSLAATKARRPAVKRYGSDLSDAYTKNMGQMQSAVASKNVTLTSTPDQADALARLQTLNGAAFERAYLNAVVADLRSSVQAYQAEIANGTDADLKALAQTNLPTVQRQLARGRRFGGR